MACLDDAIKIRYINGPRAERGEEYVLHRWRFIYGGEERILQTGGVPWQRVQFPLRPGFVLTIHKAQGIIIVK